MTEMKPNIITAAIVTLLLCSKVNAQVADFPPTEVNLCEQLASPDRSVREKAVQRTYQKDGLFYVCLLQKFDELQKNQPADAHFFEGSFATIIQVVGDLRVDSAIGRLFSIVDFQLDPATVPIAQTPTAIRYYPAAYALTKIGGKEVIATIFQEITQSSTDIRLRFYASIMAETLGRDLALLAVKQKLDSAKRDLARAKQEGSDFKSNLEIMSGLLEGNERILYIPKSKMPELKAPPLAPK